MTAAAERPPNGLDWLGNARTFERNRRECQELADREKRDGYPDKAATWQGYADLWRESRDREQRHEEMRQLNRRVHRR